MEQRRAGYYLWLNDQSFYPDLASAAKKSAEAMSYCRGEHDQVYGIKRGRRLNPDGLYENPWRIYC